MNQKTIFLIRHGFSLHNELFPKIGVQAFRIKETIDSPLTEEGHNQSIQLGKNWTDKHNIELVLVSPLTRALETAMNIFGDTDIPIICQEFIREYPIGEDTCNQRSSKDKIKNMYPQINFNDICMNEDTAWTPERESIESLNQRIEQTKEYINKRNEKTIAVITHSSFIGKWKDNYIRYQENGDTELKHCYPYEYKL